MAATIQHIELPKKPRALDSSTSVQEVSQELITNGDFATGDFTGWTDSLVAFGAKSIEGGAAR